ncbi:MAG: non-canonical purine NTP pyrophosphatase [Candidatus Hodarchaeota archaeon]
MKKQVLIGTTNHTKRDFIQESLESLPIQILSLEALNISIDVKEDGKSPEENAKKKAMVYFTESEIPTFATDGGLYIEKFPAEKQSGVFVKRIRGADRDVSDEEIVAHYMKELEKVGGESIGIWSVSVVLVTSINKIFSQNFSFKTILTSKTRGILIPGVPLDSLMLDPATGKHYSDMTYKERPDSKWIFEFMKQHLSDL